MFFIRHFRFIVNFRKGKSLKHGAGNDWISSGSEMGLTCIFPSYQCTRLGTSSSFSPAASTSTSFVKGRSHSYKIMLSIREKSGEASLVSKQSRTWVKLNWSSRHPKTVKGYLLHPKIATLATSDGKYP